MDSKGAQQIWTWLGASMRDVCTYQGCQSLAQWNGLCGPHGGNVMCAIAKCCIFASGKTCFCWKHPFGGCRILGCVQAATDQTAICWDHRLQFGCRFDRCSELRHGLYTCQLHSESKKCSITECRVYTMRDLCHTHNKTYRCRADNCSELIRSGDFCVRHIRQRASLELLAECALKFVF